MTKTPELVQEMLRLNAHSQLDVSFRAGSDEFVPAFTDKDIDTCISKNSFPMKYTEGTKQHKFFDADIDTLLSCSISVDWKDEHAHSKYIQEQFDRLLGEAVKSIDYDEEYETIALDFCYEGNGNYTHYLRFLNMGVIVDLRAVDIIEDYMLRDPDYAYSNSDNIPFIRLNATTTLDSDWITVKKVKKKDYYDFVELIVNASSLGDAISLAKESIRSMDILQPTVTTNAPSYLGNDVDTFFELQRDIDAGLYNKVKLTRVQKILKSMGNYVRDIRAAVYQAMINENFLLPQDYSTGNTNVIQYPASINFKDFSSVMHETVSQYILYYTTLALVAPQNLSMVKLESTPTEEDLENIDNMRWEVTEGNYVWESNRSENILDTYQDVKSFL